MDSNYHLSILYERLKDMNNLGGSDWSLKFNNDPKHQSKIDFDYLERKKVDYIEWPPYPLDLSLI